MKLLTDRMGISREKEPTWSTNKKLEEILRMGLEVYLLLCNHTRYTDLDFVKVAFPERITQLIINLVMKDMIGNSYLVLYVAYYVVLAQRWIATASLVSVTLKQPDVIFLATEPSTYDFLKVLCFYTSMF